MSIYVGRVNEQAFNVICQRLFNCAFEPIDAVTATRADIPITLHSPFAATSASAAASAPKSLFASPSRASSASVLDQHVWAFALRQLDTGEVLGMP